MTLTEWEKILDEFKVESEGCNGFFSMDPWALVSEK
jgi:hypothetical protein